MGMGILHTKALSCIHKVWSEEDRISILQIETKPM